MSLLNKGVTTTQEEGRILSRVGSSLYDGGGACVKKTIDIVTRHDFPINLPNREIGVERPPRSAGLTDAKREKPPYYQRIYADLIRRGHILTDVFR
ncbi:8360_t:CDS:2, partial [Acaulospora morrowiae]